ncbi:MAG: 5-dehydro-4-deoxy-D-glucuronate isomerase [Pseudomonadales bacterium]
MKLLHTADRTRYKRMTTEELRESFVIEDLFQEDTLNITYTDVDRAIVGAAVPTSNILELPTHKELAAEYFCQRRELGIINIGAEGSVTVDGTAYLMSNKDSLYVSRGSKEVSFSSTDSEHPAKFYLVSYPAHRNTITQHVPKTLAKPIVLGTQEESNCRTIYQSIRPGIVDSCQLVMGFTELEPGNVWNTKPPHTHRRRTEVYMYFDMQADNRVFHMMGEPHETRSVVLSNGQVILSPSWSIHSGAGTSNYTFIWAMGGENQDFDDMDHLTLDQIR